MSNVHLKNQMYCGRNVEEIFDVPKWEHWAQMESVPIWEHVSEIH